MNHITIKSETYTTVTLSTNCPICGKAHTITVDKDKLTEGISRRKNGYAIQNAFPTFTPSQREFLMTGICDDCWDNM